LEGLAPSHDVQAISKQGLLNSECRDGGPPRQSICLFRSEGCLLKQTFSECRTQRVSWSSRDRPNAALYPDWSLLQHRSKSNNRSDEMLTQTDVGYWHLSDLLILAANVGYEG
jgi:hypothetical protein